MSIGYPLNELDLIRLYLNELDLGNCIKYVAKNVLTIFEMVFCLSGTTVTLLRYKFSCNSACLFKMEKLYVVDKCGVKRIDFYIGRNFNRCPRI